MDNLKYEVSTTKSFADALAAIAKSLEEQKFGILWQLNFKDKLREKGIEFPNDFMILEVCNPFKANEVLTRHIDVGYFLPCKLVVYENEGTVRIGMMNPEALIGLLGYSDLGSTAKDVQDSLVKAIDQAAK